LIWEKNQPQRGWEQLFVKSSSEEYWAICESMTQRTDGNEEDFKKLL